MTDRSFLAWPFFEDRHRALADALDEWAARTLPPLVDHHDVDGSCRRLVAALGEGGWLDHAAPDLDAGGPDGGNRFDVRALCLVRETLGRHAGLADFAFAMQGLGSGPITLFGTAEQRRRFLAPVRAGTALAAFALSEADAGSDAAALATRAARVPGGYRIDGEKTWISNGGIAGHYVVFARTGEGTKGVSAFVVPADTPGLTIAERIEVIAPHPLATLRFENCVVPEDALLGREGEGFRIAMATLDVFRPTVGAAALGFARRALDEAARRSLTRRMFGATLGDLQITQAQLAEMALDIDASALLVYRAAWAKDRPDLSGVTRITREAAMAKLHATEAAQSVIDKAVQLFGGLGVKSGTPVEELYREIRALRIYEGASEVQKVIIARQLLAGYQEGAS
ncbi:MAG TPA: acyl-CoA dehydrogenase family protein [Azospirillaceae bacterium]|nr:acyl-CoA dehydrogenase family protein [Azospirillaceae bacterium]